MNKREIYCVDDDEARRTYLNSLIKNLYEHLSPDEAEAIATVQYEKFETRMFEIIRVRPRSSLVMDLFEDIEFAPVRFPKELIPHLREHDVFMGIIGFKNSAWSVVHLSPCYESEETFIEFDIEEADAGLKDPFHS